MVEKIYIYIYIYNVKKIAHSWKVKVIKIVQDWNYHSLLWKAFFILKVFSAGQGKCGLIMLKTVIFILKFARVLFKEAVSEYYRHKWHDLALIITWINIKRFWQLRSLQMPHMWVGVHTKWKLMSWRHCKQYVYWWLNPFNPYFVFTEKQQKY